MAGVYSRTILGEHRWENFSGLAVIVANDYSISKEWKKLTGTLKDGESLTQALKLFNFVVCPFTNVTCTSLQSIIKEMASLPFHSVRDYSCMMFIFAGHGNSRDEIILQDDTPVDPVECIIKPLLPERCKTLGNIPKVFLLDACRGSNTTKTTLVARGSESPDLTISNDMIEQRGGELVNFIEVPAAGNFLIARSTMESRKAYEERNKGGIWFSALANFLVDLKEKMSIEDILTHVNERIVNNMQDKSSSRYFQQPEKFSRLNQVVDLQPEACQQLTSHVCLLKDYMHSKYGTQVEYGADSYMLEGYGDVYQGIVTLCSSTGLFIQYKGTHCHYTIEDAHEEAAKIAYTNIQNLPDHTNVAESAHPLCDGTSSISQASPHISEQGYVHGSLLSSSSQSCPSYFSNLSQSSPPSLSGPPMQSCQQIPSESPMLSTSPPSSADISVSTMVAQPKLSNAASNYRSLFHEYCQKETLKPRFDFVDEETGTGIIFKCSISFMQNGHSVSADSGGYYLRKDDAKEIACREALKISQEVQSRGAVAETVSYKSKLKEFYDKRGEPNTQLKYLTSPSDSSGNLKFVSSIFIKELGKVVSGTPCKSKKEAEQSTAQLVLELLRRNNLL